MIGVMGGAENRVLGPRHVPIVGGRARSVNNIINNFYSLCFIRSHVSDTTCMCVLGSGQYRSLPHEIYLSSLSWRGEDNLHPLSPV